MPGVVRFNLDLRLDDESSPCAGDVLFTSRLVYLVTEARPVDSSVWPARWTLHLRRLGPRSESAALLDADPPADGARAWFTERYRRGEGPREHFADG